MTREEMREFLCTPPAEPDFSAFYELGRQMAERRELVFMKAFFGPELQHLLDEPEADDPVIVEGP